jgi:hypothetical protein
MATDPRPIQRIDVTLSELYMLHNRIEARQLLKDDWPLVDAMVSKLITLAEGRQERMLAKIKNGEDQNNNAPSQIDSDIVSSSDTLTEKDSNESFAPKLADAPGADKSEKSKRKGHGRNGIHAFNKAKHIVHALSAGIIGMRCEVCGIGRISRYREKVIIRVIGQPLFAAEAHHYEQGRCKNCGRIIRADGPAHQGIGTNYIKYDWSACAMLIFIHYFGGEPFKRLESMHQGWGIALPDANQWDVVNASDDLLFPLYKAIERYAIRHAISLQIDDTGSMIVAVQREIQEEKAFLEAAGKSTRNVRTGINATGMYWKTPNGPIILFCTGRHHAGEVIDQLLKYRKNPTSELVKVTDGASKNFDHNHKSELIEAACNAHAFLKFRDIKDKYPEEYAIAGQVYKEVFDNDDKAKDLDLNPIDRMLYHRQHSKPLMLKLKAMCKEKIESKLVEPNSSLWEPLSFIINQWDLLTKFYEKPGVPLDSNLVEQSLIIPVRYLAGSFNYQTLDGATVGDHCMSLIATARANEVEPVMYITECLRNNEDLAKRPDYYLPWVFRERMKAQAA